MQSQNRISGIAQASAVAILIHREYIEEKAIAEKAIAPTNVLYALIQWL